MGRLNGASIGPSRDLRDEDGERTKLAHEGTCKTCGRSSLAELCRTCSKAAERAARASVSHDEDETPAAAAEEPKEASVATAEIDEEKPVAKTMLRCGINDCAYETERPASLGAHKYRAHAAGKKAPVNPAPKPKRSPRVHRDVKPAKVLRAAAAPEASADPAFDVLFALRALDEKERAWVLRVANEKWGGGNDRAAA